MPSETNFAFLHGTPQPPSGFRNTYPQIGGTDPAYISNYYDSIGNVTARTTTTETIAIADQGKLVTFTNTSTISCTIDSTVPVNFVADILNNGPGLLQLSPSAGLQIAIGNAAPVSVGNVSPGTWGRLYRNETQWWLGFGSASGGGGGGFTNPMTTKGDIIVAATGGTANRLPVGTNGQYLTPDSTQTLGIKWSDMPERTTVTIPGTLSGGQITGAFVAAYAITFAANLAGSAGAILTAAGGVNPTATATFNIYKNASLVANMVISTSGAFTFTTVGGVSVTFNANDAMVIIAPGTPDATLSGFTFVLYGTKGTVPQNAISNPAIFWKGAYSGATTYDTYNIVSYVAGVYISLQPTTGNAPSGDTTSTAFWAFVMGFGYTDRGVYNPATSYVQNDTVRYIATGTSYGTYRCISPSTGNVPTNATFWVVVAQAGVDGSTSAAQVQQQAFVYVGTDTGTANHIVVAPSPAFGSYIAGDSVEVKAANTNTGITDINISGLGAKTIKNDNGTDLFAGQIKAGGLYRFTYDGTNFYLIGPIARVIVQTVDGATSVSGVSEILVPRKGVTTPSTGVASIPIGRLLLYETTINNVATVDITNTFTTDFEDYEIRLLDVFPQTNSVDARMLVSDDNGVTWKSTAYYYSWNWSTSGNTAGVVGAANQAQIVLMTVVTNAAGSHGISGRIDLQQLSGVRPTFIYQINGTQSTVIVGANGQAVWNGTTTITALRFLFSSGNLLSGKIRVYAVPKST